MSVGPTADRKKAAAGDRSSASSLTVRLKDQWQHFCDDKAGARFENLYKRRRGNRGGAFGWGRVAIAGAGIALLLAGIFLLAVPGPGLLVVGVGLGLLGGESLTVARMLDRMEVLIRPIAERLLKLWRDLKPRSKAAVIILGGLIAASLAAVCLRWLGWL